MNKKYIKLQIQPLSGMSAKFKSTLNWELKGKGGEESKRQNKNKQKKTQHNNQTNK